MLLKASTDDDAMSTLIQTYMDINKLTSLTKRRFRYQCIYLSKAYEIALQKMNSYTWLECCNQAVKEVNDVGIIYISSARTVTKWNREFRVEEKFQPAFMHEDREPKLFSVFPEARNDIVKFCSRKVIDGSLSIEALSNEVKNKILPQCYDLLLDKNDTNHEIETYEDMLKSLNLKTVGVTTSWRLLKILGFKYSEQEQCYYTDGHEREDVVFYRNEFITYYFKCELQTMMWVQLSKSESINLEKTVRHVETTYNKP